MSMDGGVNNNAINLSTTNQSEQMNQASGLANKAAASAFDDLMPTSAGGSDATGAAPSRPSSYTGLCGSQSYFNYRTLQGGYGTRRPSPAKQTMYRAGPIYATAGGAADIVPDEPTANQPKKSKSPFTMYSWIALSIIFFTSLSH